MGVTVKSTRLVLSGLNKTDVDFPTVAAIFGSYRPGGGLESGFHLYLPPNVYLFKPDPNGLTLSYSPPNGLSL